MLVPAGVRVMPAAPRPATLVKGENVLVLSSP